MFQIQYAFSVKFECRATLSRFVINGLVNKFQMIGTVVGKKKGTVCKWKTVGTPENIAHVQ
jgi:hypothetical protein